jgi:four helix bundle protein
MFKGSAGSAFSATALRLLKGFSMPAKDFTVLIAWQRADALEQFALQRLKHPALARDAEFCEQTSDSANSGSRNLAEGFGRFAPPQFANFVRIAVRSEMETKNQIIKAWQRGALTDPQKEDGLLLCRRALRAAIQLRLYLDSPEANANARRVEAEQALRRKGDGRQEP